MTCLLHKCLFNPSVSILPWQVSKDTDEKAWTILKRSSYEVWLALAYICLTNMVINAFTPSTVALKPSCRKWCHLCWLDWNCERLAAMTSFDLPSFPKKTTKRNLADCSFEFLLAFTFDVSGPSVLLEGELEGWKAVGCLQNLDWIRPTRGSCDSQKSEGCVDA